ncbi:hypothetical protein ACJ41O_003521 [Fusarium nematophilum]
MTDDAEKKKKPQEDAEMSTYDVTSSKASDVVPSCPTPMDHYTVGEDMEYTTQMLHLLAEYTGDHGTTLGTSFLRSEEQRLHIPTASPSPLVSLPSSLPGFIKPLPSGFASDDLTYLQAKGALILPNEQFQNALIWSFFEYVYPFMPVVDLEQFLESVHGRDGSSGQISLLLFQAVLFAGTAHVKMDHLKEVGFQTRRQARKAFFQRVRLLYDFNTESDHVVLVQAILLMTLWYETPKEHRNTWHWIDVAISQAFAAGLHRESTFLGSPPAIRAQKLRRRLWWACLMRDRLVSLGMKRPPRIKDDDYCVPALEEADFRPEQLLDADRSQLEDMCSYVQDTAKRTALAGLCIAKANLCRRLNYYLRSRYSIFTENAGDETAEIMRIARPNDKAAFMSCNEDLVAWQNSLPAHCRYRPLSRDINQVDTTVALHRTILHMIYYASVSALHRSRFTLLLHDQDASLFDQELSKIWMQHSAIQVSDMAADIHRNGLDGLLPTLGLSVVVSAAAVHLLEIRGIIQADRKRAHEGYRHCMTVIDSLADMYVAADLAKDAMEWAFVKPTGRINEEVESTLPSSQSPTITDTAPLEVDDYSKSMPLGVAPGSKMFADKAGEQAELEGDWLDYPTALGGFENCVLFSDVDV